MPTYSLSLLSSFWIYLLLLIGAALVVGCAAPEKHPEASLEQLYKQALEEAAVQQRFLDAAKPISDQQAEDESRKKQNEHSVRQSTSLEKSGSARVDRPQKIKINEAPSRSLIPSPIGRRRATPPSSLSDVNKGAATFKTDVSDIAATASNGKSTNAQRLSEQPPQTLACHADSGLLIQPSPLLIGEIDRVLLENHHDLAARFGISPIATGTRQGAFYRELYPQKPEDNPNVRLASAISNQIATIAPAVAHEPAEIVSLQSPQDSDVPVANVSVANVPEEWGSRQQTLMNPRLDSADTQNHTGEVMPLANQIDGEVSRRLTDRSESNETDSATGRPTVSWPPPEMQQLQSPPSSTPIPREPFSTSNYLLNESFLSEDLRVAIEQLAMTAGEKIILDEQISGTVTAEIQTNDFEKALNTLLLPFGFLFATHEDTYIIAPPDPKSPLFPLISEQTEYATQFRPAKELAALIPQRYETLFRISESQNTVLIEAPQKHAEEILDLLAKYDRPVAQVILEAIVCVSSPDSAFRFGLDWNHILTIDSTERLNIGVNGLSFAGAISPYGAQNVFNDFAMTSAFVRALEQKGLVQIRSVPRAIARNNEKAQISIARETFFSLQPANSNVLFRQDVQSVESGIVLEFTPHIQGDIVSLDIHRAEVSEDIRTKNGNPDLTANPFPIINRRFVETKVDVRNGQTIALGGLVQRQFVNRQNEIPVLSKLPVVGQLFTTKEKQQQEAEISIFISPRIIRAE